MRASKALAIILATSRGFSSSGHPTNTNDVLFGDVRSCMGSQRTVEPCRDLPPCVDCIPVNCAFDTWEEWFALGGCTGLCQRSRVIATSSNGCGKPCSGALTDTKPCPEKQCNLPKSNDCALSDWSTWSTCSQNQRTRGREELVSVQGDGLVCNDASKETEACISVEPAECEFSAWAAWSTCTHSCASGYRVRTRVSLVAGCVGALRMAETCNTVPCELKQDCVLGAWSEWTNCDFRQTRRSRDVQTPTKGGGKPCSDSMEELMGCSLQLDVVDCSFSQWSKWSQCSRSCGGGQSSRERLAFEPRNGGQQCSPSSSLQGTRPCNTQACSVAADADCAFSDWTRWTACPTECGTSSESRRSRDIEFPARTGGHGCQGSLVELKACESAPCDPTDCEWGAWETWSVCTRTCDAGHKDRQRSIVQVPLYGGKTCSAEAMKEVRVCGTRPCKVCHDGAWGEWSEWLACSATCGDGFTSRSRFVASVPDDCGKNAEGPESEYAKCSTPESCAVQRDCQLSAWSDWGRCTASCVGSRTRSRSVAVYAVGDGKPCVDATLEIDVCNSAGQQACSVYNPTDCVFSNWTEWSRCSAACSGEMVRERKVVAPSSAEGQPCEGATKQMKGCNTDVCNTACVDCVWDSWSQWGICSGCSGTKLRRRSIAQMPTCGKPCSKQRTFELTGCSVGCPVEEFCVWSSWLSLGTCQTLCGPASVRRTRTLSIVTTRPAESLVNGSSLQCNGEQAEAVACPFVSCVPPQDCEFRAWTEWREGALARTCERSRGLLTLNDAGGKPCLGPTQETKICGADVQKPVDCVLSDWQAWSSCGDGETQSMRSKIVLVRAFRGAPCEGEILETQSCPSKPPEPKKDCVVQSWGDWTDCTVSCDGGSKRRQRGFEPALNGGLACVNELREISVCGQDVCTHHPDCVLEAWSDWTECSAESQKFRHRSILAEAKVGGRLCVGALSEMAGCSIAFDCVVSVWSAFAPCDKSCGGGQTSRIRQILQPSSFGGKPCPSSLEQIEGCNKDSCSASSNCELGAWDAWSACSVSCGEGQTFRDRKVLSSALEDGEGCDTSVRETQACSNPRCSKKDCTWGDWTPWSGCPCDCGGGMQNRYRRIASGAERGGKPCEPGRSDEVRPCNTQACNNEGCVDGVWGPWTSWSACSASCQGGVVMRFRLIAVHANACGAPVLGSARQTASCNNVVPCVKNLDCRFGEWSPWGDCSSKCFGVRYRDRAIAAYASGRGRACIGALSENSGCNPLPGEDVPDVCGEDPPVNCELGPMSEYGVCSASCGGGQHSRSRQIVSEAKNGGQACDSILKETSECNTQPCPQCQPRDCTWSDWSSWGACDKCDGQRQRFRSIAFVQSCGGQQCNNTAAIETGDCIRSCKHLSYCGWSEWAPWSACTATCDAGTRDRVRTLAVKVAPSNLPTTFELDAASLSKSLVDLDMHSQTLETRRLQENVVAYALGAVSLVGFGALKTVLRQRSARGVPQSSVE